MTRYAKLLAEDIPERNINARDGGGSNDIATVPEVLRHIICHKCSGRVGLRRLRARLNLQSRLPHCALCHSKSIHPSQTSLGIGDHFNKDPVAHARMANENVSILSIRMGAYQVHDPTKIEGRKRFCQSIFLSDVFCASSVARGASAGGEAGWERWIRGFRTRHHNAKRSQVVSRVSNSSAYSSTTRAWIRSRQA